ncbi:pyridoxal phosphate-dependent aminotransferase [Pandoraea anhela]|uniref:Aminotransferase n=1 Tax=Pandoraea anhela TaxID=2508295 RepID=A0A5E4WEV8_9BURK|nr:pyridoxal phosphate-dependent aminotransferase [Pandoraea anhela]VVE22961.1 pyridoxal phosphate-dependent aminotransferase [Pandoraea anhela]
MHSFPHTDMISLMGDGPQHDLAASVGPEASFADLFGGAMPPGLEDLRLGYGSLQGNASIREIVAQAHGVLADDVVLTVGGMHALFLMAFVLCRQQQEVVLTVPVFPLFKNCLDAVGASSRIVRLTFDQGYRPHTAQFHSALTRQTKLVCLTSPQNPSGVVLGTECLRELHSLMASVCPDAYLLLDETYLEAGLDAATDLRSSVGMSSKVVSVGSLSKCHGAPGLRLGWVITRDPELKRHLLLAKFNTVTSCSTVDEAFALQLLKRRADIVMERRRFLSGALTHVSRWVEQHSEYVEWVRPDAGALCCIRLRRDAFDDAATQDFYASLQRLNVRVASGDWFGDERRVFRLGFGAMDIAALNDGLAQLAKAVQACAARPRACAD